MNKSFAIMDAIAASAYAYEVNGYTVERTVSFIPDSGGQVYKYSNRQIISKCLCKELTHPEDISSNVEDRHYQEAADIITYIKQTQLMNLISGLHIPDFVAAINNLVTKETLSIKDFSYLVWIPKLADDLRKQDKIKQLFTLYEKKSRHVGTVGAKHTINEFTAIEVRYVKHVQCYIVTGHDEHGNIFSYWSSKPSKICEYGHIEGKIKRHSRHRLYVTAKVTELTYVKVKDDKTGS
jgi:hypothetical protein